MQTLNVNKLITLLNQANGDNPDPNVRKSATEELMNIKNCCGYPSALLNIWQSSQPDTLREIALLQFKNHAVSNFAHTNNAQEKEHCKHVLLNTYLNEKSEQLSKQISQCIAKLSRKEWPRNWDALFKILTHNLSGDDMHCMLRSALILSDVLAEITSMRMPFQQPAIQALCDELIPLVFKLWSKAFQFAFSLLDSPQNCDYMKLYQCLKLACYLSRSMQVIFRRMRAVDFTTSCVCGQYLLKSLEATQKLHDRYYVQLLSLHRQRPSSALKQILQCMCDILKVLLCTVRDTHKDCTLQFRFVLPNFLSYFTHLIVRRQSRAKLLQQQQDNSTTMTTHALNEVMVHALLFLVDVCSQKQYEGKHLSGIQFKRDSHSQGGGKVEFHASDANECKMLVDQFFSNDRVQTVTQCLISDLFLLNRSDLEQRCLEPCLKWQESHIEHKDDNIRTAAKQLFKALIKKFQTVCASVVVQMFQSVTDKMSVERSRVSLNNLYFKHLDPCNASYKPFFLKEAVYLAFGLRYFELHHALKNSGVSFNVIGEILTADLQMYGKSNNFKVPFLCARVIWLLGRLKDDINKQQATRQFAYTQILTHLQALPDSVNDDDLVNEVLLLRLTAAQALYRLMDDTGFEPKDFAPFLQQTFVFLLQLVRDCDASLDCMQDVLRYVCVCIRQNSLILSAQDDSVFTTEQSQQIVDSIFQSMGGVWDSCDSTESNMCRVELLRCVAELIQCMSPSSVHRLYPTLMRMITFCTECVDDDARLCLHEPGLELWQKVLYHSHTLEPSMDALLDTCWYAHMQTNSDFFDVLMAILKSYLLLGGDQFVQRHAMQIGASLTAIIPDISEMDEAFSKVSDTLCVFVQLFPAQSPQFLYQIIEHLVTEFIEVIDREKNMQFGQQQSTLMTAEQQFVPTMISKLRIESYMLFFCRLMLANTDGMLQVFETMQQKRNNVMKSLFAAMFAVKERVKQLYKQKIVVLGLLKILQGVTSDGQLIVPLLAELLPWFLKVIKDSEIEQLQFADEVFPEQDEDDADAKSKTDWTEADRISALCYGDMVSHTFMIDILLKTLTNAAQKLNHTDLPSLLQHIATQCGDKNADIVNDCKYCMDKYNEYLKNKQTN